MFGTAQRRTIADSNVVTELRRALAARAPAPAREQPTPLPTQLSVIDAALCGGLPRGKLIEIIGGAGKMAFALLALSAATSRGELCAFVDAEDALDVRTAARVGVALDRLLWVRTAEEADMQESGFLHKPESTLKNRPDHKELKAVDLLLSAGGFALIVLYVSGRAVQQGGWRTGTAWPRLIQRCEKAGTALLIASEEPLAGSFAAATLRCAPGEAVWQRAPGGRLVLHGQSAAIEVVRNRLGSPGEVEKLSLRK